MEADTTTFTTGNVVDTSGQSVEDTRDSNGDVGSVSAADTLNPSLSDTSVPAEIQRAHSLESDELNASQSSNEVPDIKQISQSLVDDAPGGGYIPVATPQNVVNQQQVPPPNVCQPNMQPSMDQNIVGSNGVAHPLITPQQLPMIDQQTMLPNNPVGNAAVEQRGYIPQPPQPAQYPDGVLQQQQQYQIQQMQRQQQMQQQLSMQGTANMYPQVSGQMAGASGMMNNVGNFQQQMQPQQAQMTYQQQMPQMQQMQQMQHAQQHHQTLPLPQQMNQPHQAQMLQQQQHQQYQQQQQSRMVRKPWHATDNSDTAIRTQMAQKIIHILHQKRPNANQDWKQKLPHMAKRLEEALYLNANSKEEYQNHNTVKMRLQQYAMSVGNRQNQQQQQHQQQQQMFLKQQAGGASNTAVHQPQAGLYPQGNMGYNRPPGVGMASQFAHSSSVPHSNYQGSDGSKTGSHTNGSSSSGTTSGNERSDAHRSQVLKQQQQRLLLLRHASKCTKTDCEVTQHCASMKELWEHIMNCKDQQCRKPHCVSSRYVLSHYSKCKETKCPVCGPVRDAILEHYNNRNNTQPPAKSQGGGATAAGKIGNKPATAAPQTSVAATKDTKGQAAPEGKPAKPGRKKTKKDDQNDQTSARSGMNGNAQAAKTSVPKTNALDPVSCALYGFTNEQIQKHLNGLGEGVVNNKSSTEVKAICMPIIEGLLKHHSGHIFAQPVDPVQYNLPDYFDIIKNPMDLGSIKKRLEKVGGVDPYRDIKQVAADVSLVFDNAILYNPKEHDIHKVAIHLKRNAENQFEKLFIAQERKIQDAKKDVNSCSLCGDGNCKFEPPVYYCQGNCGGQRIRRNAFYYSTSNNLNHWCQQCFSDLKENQAIIIPEKTIYKRDIAGSKKKHQEESDEPWVGCDICKRWVHQICGMFNSRRNVSDEVAYVCPNCVVERRNKTGEDNVLDGKKMRAIDLPHTNMSQFIQSRVEQRLDRAYKEKAEAEGIGIEAIEKCPLVSIRQVASIEKNQQVREGVRERYAHKNYPSEFPCRTKCVVLFQNIDGQDVVLFGMYVYEYGHNCPQPNQRRVYVSYLDSVHYFRPKQYRTMVYQEIIIAYLEYVKNRGFHTAHIWACPPLKGDDYILYCHPIQQKTPKDDMLRKWYQSVLNTCVERGIAHSISDLYTEFLANHVDDATILPYFEGDYWVNEAEVIIKDVKKHESREEKKKASNANLAALTNGDEDAAPVQKKKKGAPKRTRSGIKEPDAPTGPVNPDVVMAKLADIIKPMKEAFFVAHLHPPEYAEKWRVKEKEGSDSPDQRNNAKRAKVVDESMKEENFVDDVKEETNDSAGDSAVKMEVDEQKPGPVDGGNGNETQGTQEEKEKGDDGMDTNRSEGSKETGDNSGTIESKESTEIVVKEEKMDIEQNGAGDAKCGDEKKANIEPEVKNVTVGDSGSTAATTAASVENETVKVKVDPESEEEKEIKLMKFKNDMTEDVDDIQESDYFGTRQDVLQLCQGNHYQFDQLRRAKHTSMMILYHLHNPDAPKFVPLCTLCSKEILVGYRYRCDNCDVDYCQSCIQTRGPPQNLHPHPLRAMAVQGGAPTQLTEEQRKERQKSIDMHLHLLKHAANCVNKECRSKNCFKMKEFLKHGRNCPTGVKGGCLVCKRINNLLTLHARSCRTDKCSVPKCIEMREQMRQIELRQQQMDDRRRAMMNSMYHNTSSAPAAEPD